MNIAIIDDVQQDLDTLGRAAQNYYEDRQIMVQIQSFSSPAAFWKAYTPYKGELGRFAAYVRTQQAVFSVRTYAAKDRKRTI